MHKQDVIVAAVNSRVKRKTHKYGIDTPYSIKESFRLDKENGNTLWTDATNSEMSNVGITFDILHASQRATVGWRKASGHIIFDVKMDFIHNARWVKVGHQMPDPITSSYDGIVA